MNAPQTDFSAFAGAWGAYIAWLLTSLGWIVSHRLTTKRELRKERKGELDTCAKIATDLVGKAHRYYTIQPNDDQCTELEMQIKFDVYRLTKRIERLEAAHPKFDTEGVRHALMDSLVGETFESATRIPVAHNDDMLLDIENVVHILIDQLEDGYTRTFG